MMVDHRKITAFADEQYEAADLRSFMETLTSDAYAVKCLSNVLEHELEDLFERNRILDAQGMATLRVDPDSIDAIELLISKVNAGFEDLERRLLVRSNELTIEDNKRLRAEREKAS